MHEPLCQRTPFAHVLRRRAGGYTLLRLLAVIAAAGLLSALAAPALFAGHP